jgi:hypothetical protein
MLNWFPRSMLLYDAYNETLTIVNIKIYLYPEVFQI